MAPAYLPGLKAVLGFFAACEVLVVVLVGYLYNLNKGHEKMRVTNGKPAKITDLSMARKYDNTKAFDDGLGEQGFKDLTDKVRASPRR